MVQLIHKVQKKFAVTSKDTFNTVVKKNYKIAGKAILEALDLLESGDYESIPNDDKNATYNTIPSLKQAIKYRFNRLFN